MKIVLLILSVLLSAKIAAQNLVPNPSFEQYNNCPYWVAGVSGFPYHILYSPGYDSFPTVASWVAPLVQNSPDYFNICDTIVQGHGVPVNSMGTQTPHIGNGYSGVYIHNRYTPIYTEYREYLETKLSNSLVAGHQYHIHFYVSLAASLVGSVNPCDKIGAYISDTMVLENLGYTNVNLAKPATIQSPAGVFITDTSGWTKIEGDYTAHGGEQWITLGRFSDGLPQKDTFLYSIHDATHNNDSFIYCFIYIDDVCVMDITNNTSDTSICVPTFPAQLHGHTLAANYLWSTGDTTAHITITRAGIYWRRAYEDCAFHMDTFRVNAPPHISLGADRAVCKEPAYTLNNDSLIYTHYNWNTGDTNCCIVIDTSGLYTLTAYNECGSDTSQVNMTVLWPCENCVLAPDAFTPNADGYNDIFRGIVRCQLSEYQMRIYNRWGQLIYTTSNSNAGWDGTFNGMAQDMGKYYYYITYKTALQGATSQMVKGEVTLIK